MEKSTKDKALEIAQLIEDGKATDVVVIDVSKLNSWTDYFVIATVTSSVLSQGIAKQIKTYTRENDMEVHLTHEKTYDMNQWNLIDLGDVVVHLMSDEARSFYELEKLWHAGEIIRGQFYWNKKTPAMVELCLLSLGGAA